MIKLFWWVGTTFLVGRVIFENKFGHMLCCSRPFCDPKSKILLWSVAFSLDLRKCLTCLTNLKHTIFFISFDIFKGFIWQPYSPFWKKKNTKQIIILSFFLQLFFDVKGRFLQTKKIPYDVLKMKTQSTRGKIRRF